MKNESINLASTHTTKFENEIDITKILNFDSEINSKKILNIFIKSSKKKSFGLSHITLSNNNNLYLNSNEIFYGDYPLFNLNNFIIYLSSFDPDLIFINSNFDDDSDFDVLNLKNLFFNNENLKQKINIISSKISINFKSFEIIFKNFLLINNYSNIQINSILNSLLSNFTYNSLVAFYISFSILKNFNANFLKTKNKKNFFHKIIFNDYLFIHNKTFIELNIFKENRHPSLIKGIGKSKEGLSLFNLFNKCVSSQGKKLFKNFIYFPSSNENEINLRFQCIKDLINLKNFTFIKGILNCLTQIKDIEIILKNLKNFVINKKEFLNLYFSLNFFIKIYEIYYNNISKNNKISILDEEFLKIDIENIQKIFDFLNNVFDITNKNDINIKNGINEILDNVRKDYSQINDILQNEAINYSKNIPKNSFIQKFMFVFIPQFGYMFTVEKNNLYYKYIKEKYLELIKNKELYNDNIETTENNDFDNNNFEEKDKNEIDTSNNIYNSNDDLSSRNLNTNSSINSHYQNINSITDKNIMTQIEEEENENSQINNKKFLSNNDNNKNNIKSNFEEEEENELDEEINDENFELENFEETLVLKKIKFPSLNLEFQFHNKEMIYYKNDITINLDKLYGDLAGKLTDCENTLYRAIAKQILNFELDIIQFNKFISFLDVFINFYNLSEKYELFCPKINNNNFFINKNNNNYNSFYFEENRNLISEFMNYNNNNNMNFVSQNFNSFNKNIFLILGNISSGKSLFLKSIGNLVFLSQIGSFVPCKNFEFEIFSKILTNIDIIESNIDRLSGFTIEVNEIKKIIEIFNVDFNEENNNFVNDLILLDNPFKRTNEFNQNCLISGMLKFFNEKINLFKNKKNCKIFITINENILNFLKKNNVIDYNITDLYEMETKKINDNFINLYNIKKINIFDNYNNNDDYDISKLFLAKENGLDNNLFLRSLEILNIFRNKKQIFPNIEIFHKITKNLKNENKIFEIKNFIRNYNINLENNNKEFELINNLNNLFL